MAVPAAQQSHAWSILETYAHNGRHPASIGGCNVLHNAHASQQQNAQCRTNACCLHPQHLQMHLCKLACSGCECPAYMPGQGNQTSSCTPRLQWGAEMTASLLGLT